VNDGQGGQLAGTEPMPVIVVQRKLSVAAFDPGTRTLKQLSAVGGHLFDQGQFVERQPAQRTARRVEDGQQIRGVLLQLQAFVGDIGLLGYVA
jgi:hypothetical protein